jgi:hypothetical protein
MIAEKLRLVKVDRNLLSSILKNFKRTNKGIRWEMLVSDMGKSSEETPTNTSSKYGQPINYQSRLIKVSH